MYFLKESLIDCCVSALIQFILIRLFILGKYPDLCIAKCRCYSNRHQKALVANCSYSGLQNIPDNLPEDTHWLLLHGNNLTLLNRQNSKNSEFLQYLSVLDLHSSKIRNLSSNFVDILTGSNNLLYLDLSGNEFKTLPENLQNFSSLQTLKITGNKFKCSCGNIWMKDWFLNETDVIENYENVLCQMPSGKWIPIVKMDKINIGCVSIDGEAFSTWKITGKYLLKLQD